MVISQLIGGLGNQMFQYAAGRAVSLELGVPLQLDISGFANYGLHQGFELQRVFNCSVEFANEVDVRNILGWQSSPIVRRVLSRQNMAMFRRAGLIVEPHFHYWPGINKISPDAYMAGYWQSEKYFSKVACQIREDFSFRVPMNSQNAEMAGHISRVNAVSLHVRRGDYASNPKTAATHGVCSLDYYREAIHHIAKYVEKPHFFVFSDDINWVKNNLEIDFTCVYVNHNQAAESFNDMRLMVLCQSHIIANSSFSWWGAWLNPREDKIVIAPRHWFVNQKDTQDLIPGNWTRL